MTVGSDPLWYKDAIIYELRVSSFFDANGDGIGDFAGLTEKLDYLEDLGVTALWLLPFYPSPLRDDGYDIADYTDVHPDLGTLEDFRRFLDAAHARGLRVITELVINHTSDRHPWFTRARTAPKGSAEREFYVWSDTPELYGDARIIFKDFETSNFSWDPVAGAYFFHRFYSHQPDLNFRNPRVLEAVLEVLDFWLGMGVDGLRLDAIPYLIERDGTNCENLPETHDVIRKIRAHVEEHYQDRMLLAEANQWPEDTAAYFGLGDECHMAFHFPIMPRMFMAVEMEDRFPLVDILEQTPTIPEGCQWALFLRNHDELTLEMVTEEEREYMWRAYARDPHARINLGIRRRLAPLLGGSRQRIELLNALLLSLPGTPVLYYGDEIMMGDNMFLGDRNGVRTPMQWSPDRNAGFSRANPQRLWLPVVIDPEYHYEALNVELQQQNPESYLWWVKRILALRKQHPAFGRGDITLLSPKNPRVLAFLRRYQGRTILIVANLSRFVQNVELDLRDFQGIRPEELFGLSRLPPIRRRPYALTLGPYGYYWLGLTETERHPRQSQRREDWLQISVQGDPISLLGDQADRMEEVLTAHLSVQRWFGGKHRQIARLSLVESLPVPGRTGCTYLSVVEVEFVTGPPERYLVPLGFSTGIASETIASRQPEAIVCEVLDEADNHLGLFFDAMRDQDFVLTLCRLIGGEAGPRTPTAILRGEAFEPCSIAPNEYVEKLAVQQSNSSVRVGPDYVLKLLRRLEDGINPDLEIGRFLTQIAQFPATANTVGALTLKDPVTRQSATLGILQRFVPNVGDAWTYTQGELARAYRAVSAMGRIEDQRPRRLLERLGLSPEPQLRSLIGPYLDAARLIGQRTAEMHRALGSTRSEPAFAPEPFNAHYQRQLYQSFRSTARKTIEALEARLESLASNEQLLANRLIAAEIRLLAIFERVRDNPIQAERIRIHGDYHLGQLLCTNRDFVIVDFEGEPMRPLSERRLKRSALRDVAGMLRSFQYAAKNALLREAPVGLVRPADRENLLPFAEAWIDWVSSAFFEGYLETLKDTCFLPKKREDLETLLVSYLLEKALYEISYELGHRPEWVAIPLEATLRLLED